MAKKEYIERDSIYHRVKRHTNPYGKPTLDYESGVKVLDMIKQEPAADVVEVVRCENCQHCKMMVDIIGDPHLFCGLSSNNAAVQFGDFCSYGERKEATP